MNHNPAKRLLYAGSGIFFVLLAGVGVALPGIPTVGPLLLGSYLLTKSSPALEKRLIRNRFFARYLPYLDGSQSMTTRARVMSVLLMWCSISVSAALLYWGGRAPVWMLGVLASAGLIGTVFISRFGKKKDS